MFYHARMYDPVLGRFISADSIVPGAAGGGGGAAATLGYDPQVALRPLTVDFHETGFVSALNGEHAFTQANGFHVQLSGQASRKEKMQWGPANPQALNRYVYVLNNPLRYTDPTGHTYYLTHDQAAGLAKTLHRVAAEFRDLATQLSNAGTITATIASAALALAAALSETVIGGFLAAAVGAIIGAISLTAYGASAALTYLAGNLDKLANYIEDYNGDPVGGSSGGVAIGTDGESIYFLNRTTGDNTSWDIDDILLPGFTGASRDAYLGRWAGDNPKNGLVWFCMDVNGGHNDARYGC